MAPYEPGKRQLEIEIGGEGNPDRDPPAIVIVRVTGFPFETLYKRRSTAHAVVKRIARELRLWKAPAKALWRSRK